MLNPLVSIIILNFNGLKFLERCLNSIAAQSYPNIETIFIDNASTDGSIKYVSQYSWVTIVKNNENLGFAIANNRGAEMTKGYYLLILNNDTELDKDFVEKLVTSYKEKSILAPNQIRLGETKEQGSAGNGADIFGYPYGGHNFEKTKVFYSDGSSLFIKREDFIKLGLFDEELFMFQEDIDLSWRAQLAGYSIIPCREASYLHYSGGTALGGAVKEGITYMTSYFRRYYVERNTIRNILKNYSLLFILIILPVLLILQFLEIVILLCTGRLEVIKCYFKAYDWNIRYLSNTLKKRKQVQKLRTVSDLDIIKRMTFGYSKLTALTRIRKIPEFR